MISVFENTLLFLTSDNGARVLNHGQGQAGNNGMFKCGKGTTYEGGHRCQKPHLSLILLLHIRVPAVMKLPSGSASGLSSALMSGLDVLPTVMGVLSVESDLLSNVTLHGFDLSKTFSHDEENPRDEIVYISPTASKTFGSIHALRLNQFKAHFYTEGGIFSTNEDIDCIRLRKVDIKKKN